MLSTQRSVQQTSVKHLKQPNTYHYSNTKKSHLQQNLKVINAKLHGAADMAQCYIISTLYDNEDQDTACWMSLINRYTDCKTTNKNEIFSNRYCFKIRNTCYTDAGLFRNKNSVHKCFFFFFLTSSVKNIGP